MRMRFQSMLGKSMLRFIRIGRILLGGGNGSVQVSFSIFPKGNIAMPKSF